MKRVKIFGVMLALAVAGVLAATAFANHGTGTIVCGQPIQVAFDSFPDNHHPNTVSYVVRKNGAQVDAQTKTFTGASATYTSITPTGNATYQVTTSWNTNGVSGSSDTGVKTLNCTPATTTTPSTTTTGTTTTTPPPPSVSTVTVTQPAPPAPPPVTTTVFVTTTMATPAPPPTIITHTVTKWRKCAPVKHKPKPKPKTPYQKCLAGKSNGDLWANGRCYFKGNG